MPADAPAGPGPRGNRAGLVPVPGSAGAPLTPEQKRFRKLSGQVETARESLARFKQQAREFTQRQAELTRPLVAELVSCGEVLLRAMEAFHGAQKLSPAQRRTLRRSITEHAAELIELMDGPPPAWLVEVHDRHARKTHARQVAEDKLSMQAMLGELSAAHHRLLRLAGEERVALTPPKGVSVDERVVYASLPREMPPELIELLRSPAIVTLHSAEAARHLAAECVRHGIRRAPLRLAALSPRIVAAAGDGWGEVASIPYPDDTALLALARQMCQDPLPGAR